MSTLIVDVPDKMPRKIELYLISISRPGKELMSTLIEDVPGEMPRKI